MDLSGIVASHPDGISKETLLGIARETYPDLTLGQLKAEFEMVEGTICIARGTVRLRSTDATDRRRPYASAQIRCAACGQRFTAGTGALPAPPACSAFANVAPVSKPCPGRTNGHASPMGVPTRPSITIRFARCSPSM